MTMKKKRTSKVEGSIIAHMRKLTELKNELGRYFYWDSECWRAIVKHIADAKPCLLINKPLDEYGEELSVVMARGTGPMVNLKDAHTFPWELPPNATTWAEGHEATVFNIYFTVTFDNNFDDDFDDDSKITREYSLHVPCDLEDNFTTEKFDVWAKEVAEKNRLEREQKELPVLQKLVAKYPDQVKKMLENDAK